MRAGDTYRLTLTTGEERTVTWDWRDVCHFEAAHGRNPDSGTPATTRAWLAWSALRRDQVTDLDFDDWLAGLSWLEEVRTTTGQEPDLDPPGGPPEAGTSS